MILDKKDIIFRAAEKDDIYLFHKWSNDKALNFFIGPQLPTSLNEEKEIFERNEQNEYRKVLIIDTKDGTSLGYLYLDFDWVNSKVKLSIAIAEIKFQGMGFGKLALLKVLELIFNQYAFNKCYLYVFAFNERAISLYNKCGFAKEGLLKEDYQMNGSLQDRLIMSIFRKDFIKNNNASVIT